MTNPTDTWLPQRIADKIKRTDSGCWQWTAFTQPNGYGKVYFRGSVWLAHRTVYTLLTGEIPDGLTLDHLCRNRACVNPAHLRPVTIRDNTFAPGSRSISVINAAKTHCPHGHPLTPRGDGSRKCLDCGRVRDRARQPRRSEVRRQRKLRLKATIHPTA